MKVRQLTRLMNDYGTNPRITVRKYDGGGYVLCYNGRPNEASKQVKEMTVESFTVRGIGWLEIFAAARSGEEV